MKSESGVQFERKLDIADIFRSVYSEEGVFEKLSSDKRRVVQAIMTCRTAERGGHINRCTHCGHEEQSYNSCWNRHCPNCQGSAAFDWVTARSDELLPVDYFHLVFTLPSQLRQLCYQNKKVMYDILFRASSEALKDAAERRCVKIGFFGVLHSWNQKLEFHPHIHYCAAGAGFSLDKKTLVRLGSGRFFLPVRILSKLFRGKFIYYLKRAYHSGELKFLGNLESLSDPRAFEHLISKSAVNDWVVYAKRPFAGAACVLKYLASYTHRIAISNRRLRSITKTSVTFIARDHKHKHKKRLIEISPREFSRRFLLHLLPRNFRRVRYFGYLYNERRSENLSLLRKLLQATPLSIQDTQSKEHPQTCPSCHIGKMSIYALVKPHRIVPATAKRPIPAVALGPPRRYPIATSA